MFEQLSLFRTAPAAKPAKTRHLLIGPRIVPYALRPSRSRLSMTIDERGLRVSAPRHVGAGEIEAFVHSHGEWVIRKLDEYAARETPRHLKIRDGVAIPLLGGEARVRVVAGGNRALWGDGTLTLAARPDADLDALARRGLQRRAMECFGERTALIAARAGRPVPALALSSARTRWGSCSSETGIRLNWRLIHLPLELVDYVVAHEIAHFAEMNHSPRFWAEVGRLFPDWRAARAELKARGAAIPII